jgi:two-component system alkaline phosphatase synthesis response regulator PhoP
MGMITVMNQRRILVIDDDPVHRLMLTIQLQQAGYDVVGVENGEAAIDLLRHTRFELLITDLLLPNMHGMQVIAEARALNSQIAVIIVTKLASTESVIAALNQQVHRYLIKPISQFDLLHNVAEVFAQHQQIAEHNRPYHSNGVKASELSTIQIGPLQIAPQRYRVTCNDMPIILTSTEFALLLYLAQRCGIVVSHIDIARDVLHYSCSLQEARDLVKSFIHRLRQKIEAPQPGLRLIQTVRGVGYRLLDEDEL